MDRFESLRLFTLIVELGSFTRAAAELGMPRATATHAIKALEQRVGTRLLERTTRQVRVTADGQTYYQCCAHVLVELDQVEANLSQQVREPRGVVRVDLRGAAAAQLLLPQIDAFCARHPQVELAFSNGERLSDLLRDSVDCVIHTGPAADTALAAQRLASLPQAVCASPDYLLQHGLPQRPEDLAAHRGVGRLQRQIGAGGAIRIGRGGEVSEYRLRSSVAVSDGERYLLCGLRGCGLIQLPRLQLAPFLRDGGLVEVLADYPSPPLLVSLLQPATRRLTLPAQAFVDWALAVCAPYRAEAAGAGAV